MIWNGKRYKGVQVYVGKQDGEFPGEYVVVYKCNGVRRSYGENLYDAAAGMMNGDIIPNCSTTICAKVLATHYREVSQRKIPEDIRWKFDEWIEDKE